MQKLKILGIGPKMATILLPWLAASIIISSLQSDQFTFSDANEHLIFIIGIILMSIGLIFYFSTVKLLLKGLKKNRLLTTGAFYFCQNPLYAAIILLIIPALSLLLNSWLVLTSTIVGYILFKIFINNEYKELTEFFGEEYTKYRKNTPEFFPFPFKKRFE